MIALAALVLAAIGQVAEPADMEVVVRAERAETALRDCLARRCATADDARATIAMADAQFRRGRYRDARETLAAGIRRNRNGAAQAPRSVAAMYDASATVNLHYGDMISHRRGVAGMVRVLRNHLPPDDMQVILADVRLADMWAEQGYWENARHSYASVERRYAARGLDRLALLVRLRSIALLLPRDPGEAARALARVATAPAAQDPVVVPLRLALAARLAATRGDDEAVDRLIATLRADPAEAPVLMTVPSVKSLRVEDNERREVGTSGIRWVDVGYLIGPAGDVRDADILRSAGSSDWAKPYVRQIAGRRYAPVDLPEGVPGRYRVERLTLRAELAEATGSFIKRRRGQPAVIALDLTRPDAVARQLD